ncbi:serine hydrolase [Rhizocola hellebori]|uniref:Serine hydrolase n=1 Tax=Rhizocola hellebori TaxID=1392758 RepID=A0A8J3Q8F1_9ACTN|nr:serine hydrolase domain-containing protein [Rhizocola hellebori]GIH05775.1 serine hydrolase [Rhizocola hellebori]
MLLATTDRLLLHRLAQAQSEGRAPAMAAAVVREGEVAWRHAIETTTDTQFRIGSLTKTFVAVLIMRLRDEGLLDLADLLDKHLPGTKAGAMSIAQLLSHTSGLASETPGPWWERTPGELRPELADILGEAPVKHPAGRRHHYSNPGFALLGAVVERLRGVPWGQALQREILDPLGMRRTSLLPQEPHARGFAVHPWADVLQPEVVQETGRMAPAGQLWSTIDDLCLFANLLSFGREGVLSADTVAEMRVPGVAPEEAAWDSAYGLGMQTYRANGRLLAGHTGSMPGFLCALWVNVAEGLSAVALTNTTSGIAIGQLSADLLSIVADHEPRIPATWKPLSDVDPELLAMTGPWYWGPAGLGLKLPADGVLELVSLSGSGLGTRFRPNGDGTWVGLSGYFAGETLRPMRDAQGNLSHLDLGSFVLTRQPYDPQAPIPGGVDPAGWSGTV